MRKLSVVARLALIGVMMVREERRTEATAGRAEAADQTKEP